MFVFLFMKSHSWTVVHYTNVEVELVRRNIIMKIVSETLDLDLSLKSTSVDHELFKLGIFVAGGVFCIKFSHCVSAYYISLS